MPLVTFDVFDTEYSLNAITKLEKEGYSCFYNSKADFNFIKAHYSNNNTHTLYWLHNGVLISCKSSEIEITCGEESLPIFAVLFNEEVNSDEWDIVNHWLRYVFMYGPKPPKDIVSKTILKPITTKRSYTPDGEYVIVEGLPGTCLSIPPQDIDLKNGYEFKRYFDEGGDTMYYEIISPSSPIPFTVVVKDFHSKSDEWLFSDIYASNAWASNRMECKYDFVFLQELWKHLKLDGEFTMDVVKRRVDACYPDRCAPGVLPSPEPLVYRRSIDQVVKGNKRKLSDIPDFIKRIKH